MTDGEVAQREQAHKRASVNCARTPGAIPGPLHQAYGVIKDGRLLTLNGRLAVILNGQATAEQFCRAYKGERVVPLPYAGRK